MCGGVSYLFFGHTSWENKREIRNLVVSGLCYVFPTVSQWDGIKAEIFNDLMMPKEQVGVVICMCKIGLDFC